MDNKQQLLNRIQKFQLKREELFDKGCSTKNIDTLIEKLVQKYKIMDIKERGE